MSTTVVKSVNEAIWEEFIGSNPQLEHFEKILKAGYCRSMHFKLWAANHILANPTKGGLQLVVGYADHMHDLQAKAVSLMLERYGDELSENDVLSMMKKCSGHHDVCMHIFQIAQKRGWKNAEMLERLIYGLPAGSREQEKVAEQIMAAVTIDDNGLVAICTICKGRLKDMAIKECLAYPNKIRLMAVMHFGSPEQMKEAGRALLEMKRGKKERLEIATVVVFLVDSLNDEAWTELLSLGPDPKLLLSVVNNAKSQKVKEAAWTEFKKNPEKGLLLLLLVPRRNEQFGQEAAQLIMNLPDYNQKDAEAIARFFPHLADAAWAKLGEHAPRKTTPEECLTKMGLVF